MSRRPILFVQKSSSFGSSSSSKFSKEYDYSEAGCASIFRWNGKRAPNLIDPLDRATITHWVPQSNQHDDVCIRDQILSTTVLHSGIQQKRVALSKESTRLDASFLFTWRQTRSKIQKRCTTLQIRTVDRVQKKGIYFTVMYSRQNPRSLNLYST